MSSYGSAFDTEQAPPGPPERDESQDIAFWKQTVNRVYQTKPYVDHRRYREEALNFYNGQVFDKQEREELGERNPVVFNMFKKDVDHIVEAAYAQDPYARIRSKRRADMAKAAVVLEDLVNYVWEETGLETTIKATFKDCVFGNLSGVKLVYDEKRQLWTLKGIRGDIIVDPCAYEDVREARWLAERCELPRHRVFQDKRYSLSAREKVKGRARRGNAMDEGEDKVVVWYVYTHVGFDPNEDGESSKLLVFAEDCDEFLLVEENPSPYIDLDEFPNVILRFDRTAKQFVTVPLWSQLKGPIKALNWTVICAIEVMRRVSCRPIGVDMGKIPDFDKLSWRKLMNIVPTQGPPADAVSIFNIGQSDDFLLKMFQFLMGVNDEQSGISDIARGQEGKTKTATESQLLQTNSAISIRGPSRDLDEFMQEAYRKLSLALLYYTPAFNIEQNPAHNPDDPTSPQFITKAVVVTGQLDPNGMPVMGPDGQPVMVEQLQIVPAPQATEPRKGVEYFLGIEQAKDWPQIPFEEIKCELDFSIEAGSARAGKRFEEARIAEQQLASVGTELKSLGFWSEYYELLSRVIHAQGTKDPDLILPPKDKFIAGVQHMQQMAQAAQAAQQQPPPPPPSQQPPNANPNAFPLGGDGVNQYQ